MVPPHRYPREIDRREGTAPEGRANEAVLLAEQLLRGSSLTAKYLHDMMQAVDLLSVRACSRHVVQCWGPAVACAGGVAAERDITRSKLVIRECAALLHVAESTSSLFL